VTTDHFDERAATWDDDPAHVERARVVADAIRASIPLDSSTRLLEYGAGTGLLSQELRDDVGPITVADTSSGMRDVLAAKVREGALPTARVWAVDLSTEPPPDERFDLVVTVLALHHIVALEPVLDAFAALLAGGGRLCVVDFEEEDGSFHGEGFEGHRGFARPAFTSMLERAGFTDVGFRPCLDVVRGTGTYPTFLATART